MANATLKTIDFAAALKKFDAKFDVDTAFGANGTNSGSVPSKVSAAKSGLAILLEILEPESLKIAGNLQAYQTHLTGFRDMAKKQCDMAEALLKKAGKKVSTKVIEAIDENLTVIADLSRKAEKLSKDIDAYLPDSYSDLLKQIKKRGLPESEVAPLLAKMKKTATARGFEAALLARTNEYLSRATEFKKLALKLHQAELLESEQKSLKKSGDKAGLATMNAAAVEMAKEELLDIKNKSANLYVAFINSFTKIDKEFGVLAMAKRKTATADEIKVIDKKIKSLAGDFKTMRGTIKTHRLLVDALKMHIKANESIAKTDASFKTTCKDGLKQLQSYQDELEDNEKDFSKQYSEAEKVLEKLKKTAGVK